MFYSLEHIKIYVSPGQNTSFVYMYAFPNMVNRLVCINVLSSFGGLVWEKNDILLISAL